jgi:uncharacterized damage-inducible protein DinB
MQPLRTYDYLRRARERVLDWVRPLTPEQYTTTFPIGLGTLARTLTHVMVSEWYYVERMMGRVVPPYAQWPIKDETPPAFGVLETTWREQAERTRGALESVRDWGARLEYVVEDDGKRIRVRATPMDVFTQLALHEVHHRAQAMNMLRRLGVQAEDIDFNTLMYDKQELGGSGS